jgi:5'-3' exoribonuclease 1
MVDGGYGFVDLKGLENLKFDFELGTPFRPFEQLMGVLRFVSRDHIPFAYQVGFSLQMIGFVLVLIIAVGLDVRPKFPYYRLLPPRFWASLGGEEQDWGAIVKFPFIEEKRLLKAMAGTSFPFYVKHKPDHSL